jgi:hypothetical protein
LWSVKGTLILFELMSSSLIPMRDKILNKVIGSFLEGLNLCFDFCCSLN